MEGNEEERLWRLGEITGRIYKKGGLKEMVEVEQAAKMRLLRSYVIEPNPICHIYLIPVAKGTKAQGYGSSIVFESRLHKVGVMGPLEVNVTNLIGCGVTPPNAEKLVADTKENLATLQERFPVLIPKVEELRFQIEEEIKAIEAETKKLKQA